MGSVVKGMDAAMKSMNLEKVRQGMLTIYLLLIHPTDRVHSLLALSCYTAPPPPPPAPPPPPPPTADQISMVMDKFESQFEDLDVQTQYMEKSMGNTTAMTTPQSDVERLMHQVADEHGLELHMEMGSPPVGQATTAQATAAQEQDQLTDRLTKLRNV